MIAGRSNRRVRFHATLASLALAWVACVSPNTAPARVEGFGPIVAALSEYVEAEMQDKRIPGISIALVDGDEIVWAQGFGVAVPESGAPAAADTVYRVGSVSKLFTDIAVMQLVERGTVDLDAPVQTYLPEFAPGNPFGGAITLRQLMSHRSGLVREPPVGHYFDPTQPSLAQTVASLNETELVYAPESRAKYSNAGIAVVGYVLERLSGEPFAATVQRAVLEPMGLGASAFVPTPEVEQKLAQGLMWSYDGREFVAPTFELGMAPAGSLYSSVLDLGRFLTLLFEGGGPVLAPATLQEMLTPQFAAAGARTGFGLGFAIGELAGHTSYGHGGAIYGFATQLQFLADEELGVVVCANVDVVNSVTNRIARQALEWLLAAREGRTLAPASLPEPVEPELARRLAGRYVRADRPDDVLELEVKGGEPIAEHDRERVPVRSHGGSPRIDGRLDLGPALELVDANHVRLGDVLYERADLLRPAPVPGRFAGLVGEYGWDHNVLFVYEKDGALHVLIEWIEIDRLSEVSADVFAFPERGGLYHGERLVFQRDEGGRATRVTAAGIVFERRSIQGEGAETFTIVPSRPVDELRREALATEPPVERGEFLASDLVELTTLDPTLRLDVRYASTDNFMQARVYDSARAFLQRPAAEALIRAHQSLAARGYGLLIHDAYRPWYVTKMFWDATPPAQRIFVADPAEGSRHNRGCAVDLTLFELSTGAAVEMLGLYDEMSERSYPDYLGGTSLERWHRELLREALEAEGFRVYEFEWWHFDFQGWERWRIQNETFEELARAGRVGR